MKCDIATAQSTISHEAKPVILIDTCSILDIIRLPSRAKINISHLQGFKTILNKKSQIFTVLTTTIEEELDCHIGHTCTELDRYVNELALNNIALIDVIECLNLSYKFTIDGLADFELSEKLKSTAQQLIHNSIILQRDAECDSKAHDRVALYQAPARRNKSESKDCLIIEHYFKLARSLRDASFSEKIVFVTSNSNDFGSPTKPKPPLSAQFHSYGITYCNNFQWALNEVGL
jgi:hypothetical protein